MSGKVTRKNLPSRLIAMGYRILPLLLQPKLLLDRLHQSGAKLLVVHRQDGVPPIHRDLEVRAFAGLECGTLVRKPALELRALHLGIIKDVYKRQKIHRIKSILARQFQEGGDHAE